MTHRRVACSTRQPLSSPAPEPTSIAQPLPSSKPTVAQFSIVPQSVTLIVAEPHLKQIGSALAIPITLQFVLRPVALGHKSDEVATIDPAAAAAGPYQARLTRRQCEVYGQLRLAKTNKEIANTLKITERTAAFHVNSILQRLGLSNRREILLIHHQS